MNLTVTYFLGIATLAVCCTGCMQRRMLIRSQPEGAFVTIDNQPIGQTPLSVPFVHHATREIKLEKSGFKTVKVQQRLDPEWYQRFPMSLISENFAGREIRDERLLDFQLEPKTQVQENRLLERANDLRLNVSRGTITSPLGQ